MEIHESPLAFHQVERACLTSKRSFTDPLLIPPPPLPSKFFLPVVFPHFISCTQLSSTLKRHDVGEIFHEEILSTCQPKIYQYCKAHDKVTSSKLLVTSVT